MLVELALYEKACHCHEGIYLDIDLRETMKERKEMKQTGFADLGLFQLHILMLNYSWEWRLKGMDAKSFLEKVDFKKGFEGSTEVLDGVPRCNSKGIK